MTIQEQALQMTHEEIVSVLVLNKSLAEKVEELEKSLNWFKKQYFGQKSEKRSFFSDPSQMFLGEILANETEVKEPEKQEIKSYSRGKALKKPLEGSPEDSGLRFGSDVPVKEIIVENPEIKGLSPDQYEVISTKNIYRLAQKPAAYEVLKYVTQTVKIKEDSKIITPPAPKSVLEKSFADVSFLSGLLIDKIQYHIPLYRQYQRLTNAGIVVSRSTLTNLFHSSVDFLFPVYQAQLESALKSKVLSMDETPMKAGVAKGKGKMKTSYFWPIFGDQNEICFEWKESREYKHVAEILQGYQGVLLTDGYQAYNKYAANNSGIIRAQCWSHARRKFVDALPYEKELAETALDYIGKIYHNEKYILDKKLNDKNKLLYRVEHSKPLVDQFFNWLEITLGEYVLLPSNTFTEAANYSLLRQEALKVFLQYPDVQIDTNHEEREIRSIAMGRKNWNFCWTEIGAKYVGVMQSLIRTCVLHQVNPYHYLVDVLQRIDLVKKKEVKLLTPRLWKIHFQHSRLRSDIESCN
jgi:transposase